MASSSIHSSTFLKEPRAHLGLLRPSLKLANFNFNLNVKLIILYIELPCLRHRLEWDDEAEPWLIVLLQGSWWETGLDHWFDLVRVGIQYGSFYQELLIFLQASLHHHINSENAIPLEHPAEEEHSLMVDEI